MNPKDETQKPVSSTSSVGVGSKEAGKLAEVEDLLNSERGPQLTPELKEAGVEAPFDHTSAPPESMGFPKPVITVKTVDPNQTLSGGVAGTTMTRHEAKTILSKYSPTDPKRGEAIVVVREIDKASLTAKH